MDRSRRLLYSQQVREKSAARFQSYLSNVTFCYEPEESFHPHESNNPLGLSDPILQRRIDMYQSELGVGGWPGMGSEEAKADGRDQGPETTSPKPQGPRADDWAVPTILVY